MSIVVAITGANRGIGFALVKQFLKSEGTRVIAGVRNPDKALELEALGNRVDVTKLDVSDPASVDAWARALKDKYTHIDVVVNNAGVVGRWPWPTVGEITQEEFLEVYTINAVGPFLVVQALLNEGLIGGESSTLHAVISSGAGSITDISRLLDLLSLEGNPYVYGASKAAVNMLVNLLGRDLQKKQIISVAIHPGMVATDMNGHDERGIPADESAEKILDILYSGKELQGQFYSYDGSILPW